MEIDLANLENALKILGQLLADRELDELRQAKNWCITQDVSVYFEKNINQVIESVNASH